VNWKELNSSKILLVYVNCKPYSTSDTASFCKAELYLNPFRSGSPLGKINKGDLMAISQAPVYHSSGQKLGADAKKENIIKSNSHLVLKS